MKLKQFKNIIVLVAVLFLYGSVNAQQNPNNQIVKKKSYTLSYNESCEVANWVAYTVIGDSLDVRKFQRENKFKQDKAIKTGSAKPSDYTNSGYDKGHLCPAADRDYDAKLMAETFLMSNMTPQLPAFNRGIWKRLEDHERDLAKKYKSVYIIAGGFLDDVYSRIGEDKVCVPKSFFKIIRYKSGSKYYVECYIFNQTTDPKGDLKGYMVKLEAITKRVDLSVPLK